MAEKLHDWVKANIDFQIAAYVASILIQTVRMQVSEDWNVPIDEAQNILDQLYCERRFYG